MYVRKSSLPCGVFFVPFWQEEFLPCHVAVLVARWAGKINQIGYISCLNDLSRCFCSPFSGIFIRNKAIPVWKWNAFRFAC